MFVAGTGRFVGQSNGGGGDSKFILPPRDHGLIIGLPVEELRAASWRSPHIAMLRDLAFRFTAV